MNKVVAQDLPNTHFEVNEVNVVFYDALEQIANKVDLAV